MVCMMMHPSWNTLLTPSRRLGIAIACMALFAAAGFIDSSLIHLKEIDALRNPEAFASCSINAVLDCGRVASSKYAHFAGLPVSLLGICFYLSALVASLMILLGFPLRRWMALGASVALVGSLFFSLRLLYVSWFGIGVLCPYCLVSNLTNLGVVVSWLVAVVPNLLPKRR